MTFRTVPRRGYFNLNKKTWQETVVALVPTDSIVWRLNNTSTITNLKGNSALNGTVQGSPSLVNSPFGNSQGLALNADGRKVIISTNASLNTLSAAASFTIMMRLNLSSSASGTRFFMSYANTSFNIQMGDANKLTARLGSTTTPTGDALAISTPNITEDANNWVAAVYNAADKLLAWKLYQGSPTLSLMALSTDTALSAARPSYAGNQFNLGDRSLNDNSIIASMFDVFIYTPNELSLATMTLITDATPD